MIQAPAQLSYEEDNQRRSFLLDPGEFCLGRRGDCDLVFKDASVSREHARIVFEAGVYYLTDLDSSQGSRVGEVALKPFVPWPLRDGDAFEIGKQKLVFSLGEPKKDPLGEVASLEQHYSDAELTEELSQYKAALFQHITASISETQRATHLTDSLASEMTRLESYVESRFKEYAVLQEISQIIVGILDLRELLTTVLNLASRVLKADRGFILLYDAKTNDLRSMVTRQFDRASAQALEHDVHFSQTIARSCFNTKELVIIEDAMQDERFASAHSIVASSIRSVVCLPLLKGDKVLGVLYLDNLTTPGCFHQHQVNFLKSFAAQTALALDNARLYTQAVTDGLTQLYNRKFIDERIGEEIVRVRRYSRNCSILLLDVDHFKRVNDTYGHQTGDVVLRGIAAALQEQARGSDLVARYGGEEFCMLLAETDRAGAQAFSERLRLSIEQLTFPVENGELKVTISGGLATYTTESRASVQAFVNEADQGLYRAKQTGRNKICWMLDE